MMREWRAAHPPSNEQRRRANCRAYSHMLLKRGQLQRHSCERCGQYAQMHHDSYDNPRRVRWLCAGCYRFWRLVEGTAQAWPVPAYVIAEAAPPLLYRRRRNLLAHPLV